MKCRKFLELKGNVLCLVKQRSTHINTLCLTLLASCGNSCMPIARTESTSLWMVYKHPKCHADAVNLRIKPPNT